jgi:hypothetical protein
VCFIAGDLFRKSTVSKLLALVSVLASSLADGSITQDEAKAIAAKIVALVKKDA